MTATVFVRDATVTTLGASTFNREMAVTETTSTLRPNTRTAHAAHAGRFELWFGSLFNQGRGFAFACDAEGRVSIEGLSVRGRRNYLFARAMVGREFATPSVRTATISLHS
ncbi:hypothetical protein [Variovorax ginsengisoli]